MGSYPKCKEIETPIALQVSLCLAIVPGLGLSGPTIGRRGGELAAGPLQEGLFCGHARGPGDEDVLVWPVN